MTKQGSWTIRVDWRRHTEVGEDELEQILEGLVGLHPAVSIERTDAVANPLHMSATVTLEAGSLRQATTTALQAVESAADARARGIEVLETEEFDRQLAQPQIPELVGHAEIAAMAGVTRQRAAQLSEIAGFPPAVVQVKSGPLRVRRQVASWLATWERKSGRPKKEQD